MIVPAMAISNWALTRQIYSEETNGVHAHNRDRVPLKPLDLYVLPLIGHETPAKLTIHE